METEENDLLGEKVRPGTGHDDQAPLSRETVAGQQELAGPVSHGGQLIASPEEYPSGLSSESDRSRCPARKWTRAPSARPSLTSPFVIPTSSGAHGDSAAPGAQRDDGLSAHAVLLGNRGLGLGVDHPEREPRRCAGIALEKLLDRARLVVVRTHERRRGHVDGQRVDDAPGSDRERVPRVPR